MVHLFVAFCMFATVLWSTELPPQEENEIFFQAVKERNLNKVEELIRDGFVVKEISDANGMTPLHFSASLGDEKITHLLINEKMNIEAKEKRYGLTPLHVAVMGGFLEIVKLLIEKGASLEATDINGHTPLILAAWEGNLEILKFLKDQKANLKAKTRWGTAALHVAVFESRLNIVEFLVEDAGFDKDATDEDGMTPLHLASKGEHEKVVCFLLSKGANKKIKDREGYTPLIWAIIKNNLKLVELLVDREENGSIVDNGYNKEALEVARELEHTDIIQFLEIRKPSQGLPSSKELLKQGSVGGGRFVLKLKIKIPALL